MSKRSRPRARRDGGGKGGRGARRATPPAARPGGRGARGATPPAARPGGRGARGATPPAARPGGRGRRGRRSLVGQSALTTLAATVGLLSGLVADAAIAYSFGAGAETDAFFVGGRLPLALATILLIAANQALVPAFSSWLVLHGEARSGRLSSAVVLIALGSGAAVAGLLSLLSEPLCSLIAPGLSDEATAQAARVLSVMTLVIPLVAAAEVLRAYLNARRAFVTPALVNVVLNLTIVAVVLTQASDGVLVVAWAYVAGSALRTTLLLVMALRRGLHVNPLPELRRREPWSAVRLCGRPLSGAGLAPAVRVVEQAFVSHLPAGAVSLLNYGYRLVAGLSGAVLFRSVIVTLVPRLSEAVARGQAAAARQLTGVGVRLMLVVSLPLAAFIGVLAEPAVRLLFERGKFSAADAALLGVMLALFAASMPPDALSRAQMAPYFSRLDTKVPFRNALVGMLANVVLLPMALLGEGRDATLYLVVLAFVLSRWIMVLNAQHCLRRDGLAPEARVRSTLALLGPPVLLASGAMLVVGLLSDLYDTAPGAGLAGLLLLDAALGLALLGGAAWLSRARFRQLLAVPIPDKPDRSGRGLVEGQVL